jgi:hypothetical protein
VSARLEVVPSDLLSLQYELRENGAPVGRIENTPLHMLEKGKVAVNGREYTVLREGVLRAAYLLRDADGAIRARAEREGWAGSAYRLRFDASQVLLKKKMIARRETYLITDAAGEAGCIVRESLLSRRMTVALKETASGMPREILLFMVWIALMIHRKDGADSAPSGA